jgi:small redox-active disulfide protein 2
MESSSKREMYVKEVKVLGPGCPKCQELMKQTELAVQELGLECSVEKVTDIQQITSYGVMMTPALVVDGEVKVTGKIPALDDIKGMIADG